LDIPTDLAIPEDFSLTHFKHYVYVLAQIVPEFHSSLTLSGDNLEICHLPSWGVCAQRITEKEHVLSCKSSIKTSLVWVRSPGDALVVLHGGR
jgi:hypothetical protein